MPVPLLRLPAPVLLALLIGAMFGACGGDDDDAATPGSTDSLPSSGTATVPATASIDQLALDALDQAYAAFPTDLADGYAVGAADAPLTITVYEDFQCPFCLRYTTIFEPLLVDEYVKAGHLRLEFQHLPILGPESESAATAAECAAQQDLFWELHHELFRLQAASGQLSSEVLNMGRFSDDALQAFAGDIGLDMAAYDACFADPATLETVQDMAAAARALGLTGTPGFVINGMAMTGGAPASPDAWRQLIDEWLAALGEEG